MTGTQQTNYWNKVRNRRCPRDPVVKAFVTPKLRIVAQHIGINDKTTILDVGCGNGFFTWYLAQIADTTGLDTSERMLSLNPCSKLVLGSVMKLPFDDNSFDLVFCADLLHHLDDPLAAISEMKRVSRKFVVSVEPNRNNLPMALFSVLVIEERKALRYSMNYLARLYMENGLIITGIWTTGMIAPNKTPRFLLPLMSKVDRLGNLSHIIIGEKF